MQKIFAFQRIKFVDDGSEKNMQGKNISVLCVGDVLTTPLLTLDKNLHGLNFSVSHADIDQHIQILLSRQQVDVLVLHAAYDYYYEKGGLKEAELWAEQYCNAIIEYAKNTKSFVVINTIGYTGSRIVGMDHLRVLRSVARINEMIYSCADQSAFISIADINSVLSKVGYEKGLNIKNSLVMRMPYTGYALAQIRKEYSRVIRERYVPRKKVVVVDGDNTLWKGIIGEDGLNGIDVGSQYPGVTHRIFQQQLASLRESGVLLALASKNNEQDVREIFDKLKMPLQWSDFTASRVNWLPKSDNIKSMADELSLGVDSFVFIDDNQFEIEQVKHALPSVDCYLFDGKNPDKALGLLFEVSDLNVWSVTKEDVNKARQYAEEVERKQLKTQASSLEDYLRSLEIRIEVGRNRTAHLTRIAQLTNKTNQFNLTTKRYSEVQMHELMDKADVFDFRVIDRFGDMGIVGVVIVVNDKIDTFLMSCRALGRQVEGLMLKYVCEAVGRDLQATYVPTAKNAMVENFYESNGFALVGSEEGIKNYRFSGFSVDQFIGEIIKVES